MISSTSWEVETNMSEHTCPKCGSKNVALIKKEIISPGFYRKSYKCDRCGHIWKVEEKA